MAITKDKAFVTYKDLKNYTDTLKKYIDSKLLPIPDDCTKLAFTVYSSSRETVYCGWELPDGYGGGLGSQIEYFLVDDNSVIGHCVAEMGQNGQYAFTWLDGTSCPADFTFFTTSGQSIAWKMCAGFRFTGNVTVLTDTAVSTGSKAVISVNAVALGTVMKYAGRFNLYARKLK